jgi:hypothetical protein
MSWGAQNRSKDAKKSSQSPAMSDKPEPGLWPIQPYSARSFVCAWLVHSARSFICAWLVQR